MKRVGQRILPLLITLLFTNLCLAQDTVQVVTAWLKKYASPIQTVEPTNSFSDLQLLKNILNDVTVIGLGESTHGTREFFQLKHRLLRFLVTEMGFTALAMEASNTACQPVNDYIRSGKGDKAAALTGQGYMAWDNEEFLAMLDWMRAYNQKAPDEKKVKFYGMDVLCCHGLGREKVLAYLQKYAPEKVVATDSLFKVLASEDEKWPSRINQSVLQQAIFPLHELVNYFGANKDKLVAASSLKEWEQMSRYLEIMQRGLLANIKELPPALSHLKKDRSQSMAETLFYLMDKEKPNAKFMVWAYNTHIANDTAGKSTGYYLRQKLGDKYYALGFLCKEGTFQTRVLLPDGFWGELKTDTILPPVPKSLSWYLSSAIKNNAFINLSPASSHPFIEKWLETRMRINYGFWIYRGANQNQGTTIVKGKYDGFVHIEHSTPVHPTKNALARSANKIGF